MRPAACRGALDPDRQTADAWQQAVGLGLDRWKSPAFPVFGLFFPGTMAGPWQSEDEFTRLGAGGELRLQVLDEAEAKALNARMGWGAETRWILLGPKEEVLGSGAGSPAPERVRGLMEATGWRSRWDLRADFLRDHPGSGDAWGDELWEQARLAAAQRMQQTRKLSQRVDGYPGAAISSSSDKTDPTEDPSRWEPAAKALHGLLGVEGWTEWVPLGSATRLLAMRGTRDLDALKPAFDTLRRGVEAALQSRPSNPSLWAAWSAVASADGAGDPDALLASLEPAPREPWPPLAAAEALGGALTARRDWMGLDHLASQALERALAPEALAGKDARFQQVSAQYWTVLRIRALLNLHRDGDAAAAASVARASVGRAWPGLADAIRREAATAVEGTDEERGVPPELAEVLHRDSVPVSPQKAPALPLTLALIGSPSWSRAFQHLKDAPALDPWKPGDELVWGTVDEKRAQTLRAWKAWGAEPHWVLLRGEDLLDAGAELPDARILADRLLAQSQPLLAQLDAFIRSHPNHMEARRARMKEVLARMPNRRLEALLLEDAKATRAPFLGGRPSGATNWVPMKELWEPAASRVLPELESGLRSWPEDVDRWLSYADWSGLHPRKPSPADLLSGLPVWKTRARGGAGPLPDEVGMAVAMRLGEEERWVALAAWGQAFWEGGLRDKLRADLQGGQPRVLVAAQWRELDRQLITPYSEALKRLNRLGELKGLEEDLKALKGLLPPGLVIPKKE